MLQSGDDMYLLRMILQTGPVVHKLSTPTAAKVIDRLNRIVRGGVFEKQLIEWINSSAEIGQFEEFNEKKQSEFNDTLKELS